MRNRVIVCFLAFHLCVILIGSGIFSKTNKLVSTFLSAYASWTGCGNGYTFFSPNVGNQTVIKTFTVSNDTLINDVFGGGETILDSRLNNVIHTFQGEHAYELLSRVIAAHIFSKYPSANLTKVSIGVFIPSLPNQYNSSNDENQYIEKYGAIYSP